MPSSHQMNRDDLMLMISLQDQPVCEASARAPCRT